MSSLFDNKTRRRYFFVSAFFGSALTLIDDILVAVFRGIVDHGHLLLGQVDLHVLDALAERGDIIHDLLDTVFTVDVGRENRRHRLFVGSLLRCTHAHTHHECKAQH